MACKDSHKVHFDLNNDVVPKDNEISVYLKDGIVNVHLGFLQVKHLYKINFYIPRSLIKAAETNEIISIVTNNESPYLKIITACATHDRLKFEVELFTHKEMLLKEQFNFRLCNMEDTFATHLIARVLGKGKGTPLLKNEIHIVHYPLDDDSDTSSDL